MKVQFKLASAQEVASVINVALEGRKLGDLVTIAATGQDLVLTVSKLGTSTLIFSGSPLGKGIEFNLTSEKIAFTHKAMKDTFKGKIAKVIEQAGGTIS